MRRIILLSSTDRHTSHNRHEGRQRRLYGGERICPNTHELSSGNKEVQRKPVAVSSLGMSLKKKDRSLTRTRSESDLIRAMAKRRDDKIHRRDSFNDEDSSDEEEDDSRHAASLRSFTKEDEERHARACMENAFHPGELCAKIGEEDEGSNGAGPPVEESTEHSPPISESASAVQSTVSPVSDPIDSLHHSETQSYAGTSTVSALKDEGTRACEGSDSENGETSATSDSADSQVDVEYLQHENDLLKTSLKSVAQERNFLAQENWKLRAEMENLRNQMRFMMSASGSSPQMMYRSGSPPMYVSGSPPAYTNSWKANQDYGQYAYYRQMPKSQTFEELLQE